MNWKSFGLGLSACAIAVIAGYAVIEMWPPGPPRTVSVAPGTIKSPNISDTPVLIDFYADWCIPCKIEKPIVESAAKEWAGRVKLIKWNVDDDNWQMAASMGINAIPSLVLIDPGTKRGFVHSGFLSDQQLRQFIKGALQAAKQ